MGSQQRTATTGIAASLVSANVDLLTRTGYFDPPAEGNPLLHAWSLAVEEQLYLVFPVLLSVQGALTLTGRFVELIERNAR